MPVTVKNWRRFRRREPWKMRTPMTTAVSRPTAEPTAVIAGVELSLIANKKSAVSQPSRRTAKKATLARPRADPVAIAPAILASRSRRSVAACLRIQKIIQTSTTAAASSAEPSNSFSALPSSSPSAKKSAAPVTTDVAIAKNVPIQTVRAERRLPVFERYARTIPTMRDASRPSRVVTSAAPM